MISSTAISSLRGVAAAPVRNAVARRRLSLACARSVRKLNDILEEYRSQNYSQTFPRRFRKDVVRAAAEETMSARRVDSPAVSAEGIEHLLQNIGMGDRMSRSEIEGIVSEVGTCPDNGSGRRTCVLSKDQMLDLISKG